MTKKAEKVYQRIKHEAQDCKMALIVKESFNCWKDVNTLFNQDKNNLDKDSIFLIKESLRKWVIK